MEEKQFITPHTSLAQLQEYFPNAYNFLIENVSYFQQIKNENILSAMKDSLNIAIISSYSQIPIHQLINKLREVEGEELSQDYSTSKPEWLIEANFAKILDARQIIMAGGHPLDQVMEEVNKLSKNQIFKLITPFAPEPLINVFKSQGCVVWVEEADENLFYTYIKK